MSRQMEIITGNGAQGAEDARRAAGVADVGIDAVAGGNLDVVPPDADIAGQDGAEHAHQAPVRASSRQRVAWTLAG